MKTHSVEIKRLGINIAILLSSVFLSVLILYFCKTVIAAFILFSTVIPLANADLILTRYKYQAFCLSAILNFILICVCSFVAIGLGIIMPLAYAISLAACFFGVLFTLANAIFIKIPDLKIGISLSILFSLAAAFLIIAIEDLPFTKTYKEYIYLIILQVFAGAAMIFSLVIKSTKDTTHVD